MRKHIERTLKHPLISGSAVLFIGTLIANVFNFLFNLFMGRNLSIPDYGVLASIISIISLAMVVANSITPTVVNFAATYFAKNELDKVRGLFYKITRYYAVVGILIFLFFLIFSRQIGIFFKIHDISSIVLTGFIIFFIFISTVNMAFLQAKLAFNFISFTTLLSTVIKLFLGILFVSQGFGVNGGIWAYVCSFVIPYILNFIPLPFLFGSKIKSASLHLTEIFQYGGPAALATFGLMSFITTDLILVKHFFAPDLAGIYAGIALVGKVIFFFSAPIGMVMFPLIVQRHTRKENYDSIFILSLLLVFIPSLVITVFYFLFPQFAIRFFIAKKEYLAGANLVGVYGTFTTIYSLLTILTNYYLSVKKTKVAVPIFIGALAQGIGIWLFHQTFLQVILISLAITTILFVGFLVYYWMACRNKNK